MTPDHYAGMSIQARGQSTDGLCSAHPPFPSIDHPNQMLCMKHDYCKATKKPHARGQNTIVCPKLVTPETRHEKESEKNGSVISGDRILCFFFFFFFFSQTPE